MIIKQENFIKAPEGYKYLFIKFKQPMSNSDMNLLEALGSTIHRVYN
jgi:hypothetical protein